jgi:hypothetical protein
MKNEKAYIKLNGKVGKKELPCVEYVDNTYSEKMEMQKKKINEIFLGSHQKRKNDET